MSTAEGDPTDVGPYIVCYDQGARQKEPDHALKNVVHNEMRLDDDQVERHVRPCKLSELEAIMAFL